MIASVRRHPWRLVAVLATTTLISVSAFALQAIGLAGAPDKSINTPIDHVNGVDANIITCTTSTTYVDLPDMSKTFTVDGPNNKKVIVMFQGEVENTVGSPSLIIRLLVDGNSPSGMNLAILSKELGTETHGMNFITDSLTPGSHTAKIQWKANTGDEVCVDNRSLIVLHDA